MTEVLARPLFDNRALRVTGFDAMTVTRSQAIGSVFTAPTMGDLAAEVGGGGAFRTFTPEQQRQMAADEAERQARIAELSSALGGSLDEAETTRLREEIEAIEAQRETQRDTFTQQNLEAGRVMSIEDLQSRYADMDVTFEYPMSQEQAEAFTRSRKEQMIREAIISRSPGGVVQTVGMFGAGLAAMATDPLEVAAMFIPVVGEANMARLVGRFGLIGGRIVAGAIEGGVGQALTEPVYYGLSRQLQLDYTMADSLLNVGLGVAFGGGIGTAAGLAARRSAGQVAGATGGGAPDVAARVDFDPAVSREIAETTPDDALAVFDRAIAETLTQQRRVADVAIRQFVNDSPISLEGVLARSGIMDEIKRLDRELASTAAMPVTGQIRRSVQIHPQGNFARELAQHDITPRSYPGLFSRRGHRDLDNLPASEWDGVIPGLSAKVGQTNGYLNPQGLIDEVVAEFASDGKAGLRSEIAVLERVSDRFAEIHNAARDAGFTLRGPSEYHAVASMLDAGSDMAAAFERIAIMGDAEVAEVLARNATREDAGAAAVSRDAAKIPAQAETLEDVTADMDDFRAMLDQADLDEDQIAEMADIAQMDEAIAARTEVVTATATCIARTL